MLQNLFKSWSLICFGIQQHVYNILDLCFKKKKQIIIDLNQIFTGNALKITALSLRTIIEGEDVRPSYQNFRILLIPVRARYDTERLNTESISDQTNTHLMKSVEVFWAPCLGNVVVFQMQK